MLARNIYEGFHQILNTPTHIHVLYIYIRIPGWRIGGPHTSSWARQLQWVFNHALPAMDVHVHVHDGRGIYTCPNAESESEQTN